MPKLRHFSKEDIGGEILPILTTGLYRDSLDALREYIQNGIDANADQIEVSIDPSTVAVTDNGHGMTRSQAERAIRLGISDKNPTENIGFRGIGIYSAFNLCEMLDVFTKPKKGPGSHIVFNFEGIRRELLVEQERRKQRQHPELYLEKLLQSHVYVDNDQDGVIQGHGTRVLLSNLLPESYKRLQDWNEVELYLQDVVPLPFSPEFRHGATIQKRFSEEDYRVVPLTLEIGTRREELYRPYSDWLFPEGEKYLPQFFLLRKGREKFGFAWICINGRRVIKDARMRGLLIKKFGFSVGNRSYLEPFFKRNIFNRRITGEIIVQHESLIPNAARSDFENNAARQDFLGLLPDFIARLSSWGNTIQQNEKARQELTEVTRALGTIAEDLPKSRRDKNIMLRYNVELADLEHRLNTHKKTLESQSDLSSGYGKTAALLKHSLRFVHDALSASAEAQKRLEKSVIKVVQAETDIKETSQGSLEETPRDLSTVLDASGIRLSDEARQAIRLFESEYLLSHMSPAIYQTLLKQLEEALEEGE
jgi:molecular chaperone HtpG